MCQWHRIGTQQRQWLGGSREAGQGSQRTSWRIGPGRMAGPAHRGRDFQHQARRWPPRRLQVARQRSRGAQPPHLQSAAVCVGRGAPSRSARRVGGSCEEEPHVLKQVGLIGLDGEQVRSPGARIWRHSALLTRCAASPLTSRPRSSEPWPAASRRGATLSSASCWACSRSLLGLSLLLYGPDPPLAPAPRRPRAAYDRASASDTRGSSSPWIPRRALPSSTSCWSAAPNASCRPRVQRGLEARRIRSHLKA